MTLTPSCDPIYDFDQYNTDPLALRWAKVAKHKIRYLNVCPSLIYSIFDINSANYLSVAELSDDGKKLRCQICDAARKQNNGWIRKESLASHLKSALHVSSVSALEKMDTFEKTGLQRMQEECELEQLDSVMLSSNIERPAQAKTNIPEPSLEEKEMWDNYRGSNEFFDAGVDHSLAAVEERERLEKEATEFGLWHAGDSSVDETLKDGQYLLDELEEDDILNELLQNAGM